MWKKDKLRPDQIVTVSPKDFDEFNRLRDQGNITYLENPPSPVREAVRPRSGATGVGFFLDWDSYGMVCSGVLLDNSIACSG